jgi:hypothetical protein
MLTFDSEGPKRAVKRVPTERNLFCGLKTMHLDIDSSEARDITALAHYCSFRWRDLVITDCLALGIMPDKNKQPDLGVAERLVVRGRTMMEYGSIHVDNTDAISMELARTRVSATDPRARQMQQQQQQPPRPPPPPAYGLSPPPPQQGMPHLDPSLVRMSLTPQHISQLPPDKQPRIWALRQQIQGPGRYNQTIPHA